MLLQKKKTTFSFLSKDIDGDKNDEWMMLRP